MKLMDDGTKMRNATSKTAWLWHDEDELLRYQPEVLDRFHHRYNFLASNAAAFFPSPWLHWRLIISISYVSEGG